MILTDSGGRPVPRMRGRMLALCLAVGVGIAPAGWAQGQDREKRSLTDLDIEFTETKLTLQAVTEENAELRRQLLESRESVAALAQSLAIANSEAEVFRREAADLRLRMEALGIEAIGDDTGQLENRLIKAVQQLQVLADEKDQYTEQLVRLNEALLAFLKTASSEDAQARMLLEEELRNAAEILGGRSRAPQGAPVTPTMLDGMVMSIKPELSLLVGNIGASHGVRIGMPFGIWRNDRQIGAATAIDVRQRITGLVIQFLSEDITNVNVGDSLRVVADEGNFN